MSNKKSKRYIIKNDLALQYKKKYLETAEDVVSMTQGVDKFITWLDENGYEIKKKLNGTAVDLNKE